MGKKKLTPAKAGKGQPTVANYYTVVSKPSENKNEEEPLKTEEKLYFRQKTMKAMTMIVLLLLIFDQRKKLLWDPTRHQQTKEKI